MLRRKARASKSRSVEQQRSLIGIPAYCNFDPAFHDVVTCKAISACLVDTLTTYKIAQGSSEGLWKGCSCLRALRESREIRGSQVRRGPKDYASAKRRDLIARRVHLKSRDASSVIAWARLRYGWRGCRCRKILIGSSVQQFWSCHQKRWNLLRGMIYNPMLRNEVLLM